MTEAPNWDSMSREDLLDTIDALESELKMAVETAYRRGAVEWTKLNYPKWYEEFHYDY
jgi:hypothetical protein